MPVVAGVGIHQHPQRGFRRGARSRGGRLGLVGTQRQAAEEHRGKGTEKLFHGRHRRESVNQKGMQPGFVNAAPGPRKAKTRAIRIRKGAAHSRGPDEFRHEIYFIPGDRSPSDVNKVTEIPGLVLSPRCGTGAPPGPGAEFHTWRPAPARRCGRSAAEVPVPWNPLEPRRRFGSMIIGRFRACLGGRQARVSAAPHTPHSPPAKGECCPT
jgi:hypothetical protein